MSVGQERGALLLCGLFGLLLIVGSLRSLIDGEVQLRRYSAPIEQGWPIVAILLVCGLALLTLSAGALWRFTRE